MVLCLGYGTVWADRWGGPLLAMPTQSLQVDMCCTNSCLCQHWCECLEWECLSLRSLCTLLSAVLEWLSLDSWRTEVSSLATGQNVLLYVNIEMTEVHLLQQKVLKILSLKSQVLFSDLFFSSQCQPEHWLNRCVHEHRSCTLACDTAACPPHILSTYWILVHQTLFIHSFIYSPLYVGVT
jgi:hypothetical protein